MKDQPNRLLIFVLYLLGFATLAIIAVFVATFLAWKFVTFLDFTGATLPDSNIDFIEVTNIWISGFALAGLVFALWLQRKDLEMQIQELEETNQHFGRIASSLEQQIRAIVRPDLGIVQHTNAAQGVWITVHNQGEIARSIRIHSKDRKLETKQNTRDLAKGGYLEFYLPLEFTHESVDYRIEFIDSLKSEHKQTYTYHGQNKTSYLNDYE